MTKPISTDATGAVQREVAQPARAGLFLVKPSSGSRERRVRTRAGASRSRSLSMWALAAAALAAPLMWWAHELLHRSHSR